MFNGVRRTSYLLFSAAIALHRSSPTVSDCHGNLPQPTHLACSAADSSAQQDGSAFLDVTSRRTLRSSAFAQMRERDTPYITASSALHFKATAEEVRLQCEFVASDRQAALRGKKRKDYTFQRQLNEKPQIA